MLPSLNCQSAVDADDLAGHISRLVGAQEGYYVGNVLRRADPLCRDLRLHGLLDLVGKGVGHVGADIAGGYGVDGDSIYWTIEDGKFVEYKNGEKTGNEVSFAEAGQLYAVWAGDTLTFYNVWDPETETYVSKTVYTTSYTPDVEIASISLVEAYQGYELSLFGGTTPTQGLLLNWTNPIILRFTNVIEKANVFEEGIKNAYTFEEGKQTPQGWTFVVRVSPANYELKAEDITFVNSMGVTFDEVEAMEVVPYKGLLTKATPANTGLWTVYAELANYDKEQFDALTWVDVDGDEVFNASFYGIGPDRFVSYAIKAQEAVSTYDLAFEYYDFAPLNVLDFYVGADMTNAQWIGNLNNRYQGNYRPGTNPSLKQPGIRACAHRCQQECCCC